MRAMRLAISAVLLTPLCIPGPAAAGRANATAIDGIVSCIFAASCSGGDVNGDGRTTVADLVGALRAAAPTWTPTLPEAAATPTPTPTATATMGTPPPVLPVSAAAGALANGLGVIPSIFTGIYDSFGAGGCPLGGTVTRKCTGTGRITVTIKLTACVVPAAGGGSSTLDGTITLAGSGSCTSGPFPGLPLFGISTNTDLTAVYRDAQGAVKLTTAAQLTAAVGLPQLGGPCFLTSLPLARTTATLTASSAAGDHLEVQLSDADIAVTIQKFASGCVPNMYTLILNGAATVETTPAPPPDTIAAAGPSTAIDVAFTDFQIVQDSSAAAIRTDIQGMLSSACFGGDAGVATTAAIISTAGEVCPTAGILSITSGATATGVAYGDSGAVDIDYGEDGTVEASFSSCVDPGLLMCPS